MENKIFDEVIRPKANELLKYAKLPDDQIKEGNQKAVFINDLSSLSYERAEGGEIIVKDTKGFELKDPHGWPLSLDEVLKGRFDKYFDMSDLPITPDECISILKDPKITPEERKRITERWNKLKTR